jgi:hypothetical protein
MNFLNWFQPSPKLKRPRCPVKEPFACFDVTLAEVSQAQLLVEHSLIRLQSHSNYATICYELLYKRPQGPNVQFFSIFRSDNRLIAQQFASRLQQSLNPLAEEINAKCFAVDAPVPIHELTQMVQTYSSWTCAHIAAHAAFSASFRPMNQPVVACLSMPPSSLV